MQKLKILKLINNNPNWREILTASPYNLSIRDKEPYILLKYSQIFSDLSNPIVKEARGLIIKKVGHKYKVVCHPFHKFFAVGDPNAREPLKKLRKSNLLVIEEKIDGSLLKIWHDEGWHVSTNGTIDAKDAEIQFQEKGLKSFYDLFLEANNGRIDFDKLDKQYTYMFELVAPNNKVIVPYERDLYYLGRKNNYTGEEMTYFEDDCFGVEILKRPNAILCSSSKLKKQIEYYTNLKKEDCIHFEGAVISNYNYKHRVKVKSNEYLQLSYQKGDGVITEKKIVEMLLQEKDDDFLELFPEYKPQFDNIRRKLSIWITSIVKDLDYMFGVPWESKKAFAEWAKQKNYSKILFNAFNIPSGYYWDGDWLKKQVEDIPIDRLVKLIEFDN